MNFIESKTAELEIDKSTTASSINEYCSNCSA